MNLKLPAPPEAAWPSAQLFAEARALEGEGDRYWDLVWLLRRRATRGVWESAAALCRSEEPLDRALGADVLAYMGLDGRQRRERPKFWRQSVPLLLPMLQTESDANVLDSLGIALGTLRDPRAVAPLASFKRHASGEVRLSLAIALSPYDDPLSLETLIELTRDSDAEVRDWATFGLGRQSEADTPALRDALAARLDDEDEETRCEAIAGLARRHDARAFEPLLRELNAPGSTLLFEAAGDLADPRLLPALLAVDLKDWSSFQRKECEAAIARCRQTLTS